MYNLNKEVVEMKLKVPNAIIDLVNLTKAKPILKVEIAKKGNLLYGSKEKFEKFSIYAAGIYADTQFLYNDRKNTLEKKIEARY
jgi:hypothetical protein